MRHYYLIDYENVGPRGLTGLRYPGKDSHICIFISNSAHMASDDVKRDILASEAEIDTFFCGVSGKNMLDFEIAAYAGAVLENPETKRVSIISNDSGYKALADYTKRTGKDAVIHHAPTILEAYIADSDELPTYQGKNTVSLSQIMKEIKKRQVFEKEIRRQLHDYDNETAEQVLELAASGTPKEQYLGLLKLLGREKGTKVYKYIKSRMQQNHQQ